MPRKLYLFTEFVILFIILPFAILHFQLHRYFILILWAFALICYLDLRKDKEFDNKNLFRKEKVNWLNIQKILLVLAAAAIFLTCYTYFIEPQKFLQLPLHRPKLWVLIMILYPLLSVYPQEIIYRAFFFHRYRNLFTSDKLMLLVNAAAFGFAHIIFYNVIAFSLTFMGGFLFGLNYRRNKSLALVSIEHALYGCLIFTIGIGAYFYHGNVRIN